MYLPIVFKLGKFFLFSHYTEKNLYLTLFNWNVSKFMQNS